MTKEDAINWLRNLRADIGKGEAMRLIDADALMQSLGITDMDCDKCAWHDSEWNDCKRGGEFEDACCAIKNALTIEERKTGKWIRITQGAIPEQYICPFCHRTVGTYGVEELLKIEYPYCHCGADMRGGDA